MSDATAESANGMGNLDGKLSAATPQIAHSDGAATMDILYPLLFGHAAAMTLKAAVLLNIPDILAEAEPEKCTLSVHEIAEKLPSDGVDEQALHRLIKVLVHFGVFSANQVSGSARYGLTEASRMLVHANNPNSLTPMLVHFNHISSQIPWHYLHEIVLYGKKPSSQGRPSFAFGNEQNSREFSDEFDSESDEWSTTDKVHRAQKITDEVHRVQKIEALNYYDGFKDVNILVDVGGYKGTTVAAIVAEHPHIRGINFDLPHVVAKAPNLPGVEHVAGNLLDGGLPSGDAILMKYVVHLFNDEESIKILQNCKKALPADGKLLIYDTIIPTEFDQGESPPNDMPPLMDMFLLVHSGGVDRTEEQWRILLAHGGFPNAKLIYLQPRCWLIEAVASEYSSETP